MRISYCNKTGIYELQSLLPRRLAVELEPRVLSCVASHVTQKKSTGNKKSTRSGGQRIGVFLEAQPHVPREHRWHRGRRRQARAEPPKRRGKAVVFHPPRRSGTRKNVMKAKF
jgi:hypothetical protein